MTEPTASQPPQSPPPPPKVTALQLAVQVGAAALLLWLYGIDLVDAVRFSTAELSAFVQPPSLAFNALAVLATLVAVGAAVYGHVNKLGGSFRGHRLLPIVAVVVLFADLFVLSSARTPLSAADQALIAVHEFARRANGIATPAHVPSTDAELRELLKDMPVPPYFVRGERVKEYRLEVRPHCTGPVAEKGGAGPGTLLYCSSEDGKEAWVSLVGLPFGRRFGAPAIVTRGDLTVAAEVRVGLAERGDEQAPTEVEELPPQGSRWEELDDAGIEELQKLPERPEPPPQPLPAPAPEPQPER